MSKESTIIAAKTLIEEGWRAEKVTIVADDGTKTQGWRWTDPVGGVSEVVGRWTAGPIKPRKSKLPSRWHMTFKQISPRNSVFLRGTLPVPCGSCGGRFPERSLVPYRGVRCCLACLLKAKTAGEREEYRRDTFAARARAYMESMESQANLGRQNAPEIMP